MATYYLAPSLKALGVEVTKAWPRAKPWPTVGIGDGWIGDASHNARKSDHNPDWDAGGIVRAVDIGIEGRDAQRILNAAIGDSRVWYVIHKGRIYSRTHGWANRAYTGSNPHNHHIHISIRHDRDAAVDTKPWLTTAPTPQKAAAPKPAPATIAPEETDDMDLNALFNHRIRPGLPRFGDMIVGTFKRSNYAMLHARNAEHGVGELAKLIKTMPGASDELRALADDIAAKVAGEVERLDAEAVADKLEINVKE